MTERVFENRTALVTGAARGIGRATAEQFLAAGAKVALLDRDRVALEAVVAEYRDGRALALDADVSSAEAVANAVEKTVATFGSLDILVNNAAVHFARAVDQYSLQEVDLLLGVNLKGALFAVQSALPALRRARGSIVMVSSMTGLVGSKWKSPRPAPTKSPDSDVSLRLETVSM